VLYLIDPSFSDVPLAEAEAFLGATLPTLGSVPFSSLSSLEQILATDPGPADGVVFFNPLFASAEVEVEALLDRGAKAGAVLLPIALREEWRRPPGAAGEFQSFDLVEQRRVRELGPGQIETLGSAFARQALSRLQPTYSRSRLRLFLCHRRADGEGLVAALGSWLERLHEGLVFRDLIKVQAGEPAQELIEEALEGADVLVLFDTPKAHESWWVAHEVSQALGRNIPIVWVRIGREEGRLPLPFQPTGEPHIEVAAIDLGDPELGRLADLIREKAFELSREQVRVSIAALRALQQWAADNQATLETLDARRLIYELRRDASPRGYPLRPAIDIVQMFAHHPSDEDRDRLEAFLSENGMGPHERECRSFDAALMLDPTATGVREVGEWSVIEHPGRFLQTLSATTAAVDTAISPTLLLLGAFPAEEVSAQEVMQATHALATTWLRLGGSIVFGGHPTFTPLLIEAGRLIVPGEERRRITIYQSRWFASPAALQELEALITVVPTAVGADRDASLTVMRTAMCGVGADAVVAIGGRTEEGGTHTPGIDQEIDLARAAGSPAFLLGAPGGRGAELAAAARREKEPWGRLGNPLTAQQNERLFLSDDYERAARMIHASLG
jgi:hypothetical protein